MRIAYWLRQTKRVWNVWNIYEEKKNLLIFSNRFSIPLYRFPSIEMTVSFVFIAAIIDLRNKCLQIYSLLWTCTALINQNKNEWETWMVTRFGLHKKTLRARTKQEPHQERHRPIFFSHKDKGETEKCVYGKINETRVPMKRTKNLNDHIFLNRIPLNTKFGFLLLMSGKRWHAWHSMRLILKHVNDHVIV